MKGRFSLRRFEWALLIGLIVSLLAAPAAGFARDCKQARQGIVRMHILAASDGEADQQDKLAVRDALLAESGEIFAMVPADGAGALEAARESLQRIEEIAGRTLRERGSGNGVRASIARMYFETRVYDSYILPAGIYDAVRLEIGPGKGRNWWCVMYPPLCLPAAKPQDNDDNEAAAKTGEIEELGETPGYRMGFAAVELWERAAQWLRELGEEQPLDSGASME